MRPLESHDCPLDLSQHRRSRWYLSTRRQSEELFPYPHCPNRPTVYMRKQRLSYVRSQSYTIRR